MIEADDLLVVCFAVVPLGCLPQSVASSGKNQSNLIDPVVFIEAHTGLCIALPLPMPVSCHQQRCGILDSLLLALSLTMETLFNVISLETLLVIGAYVALGGAYLVVVPLLLYAWMSRRWPVMGKYERLGIYSLVFLFFPGLIVFAPFLNLRFSGQGEV